MKNYKITFLMAAHNEEKLIGKAVARLIDVHKDYSNMELLVGLDGCTDRTLEIVKEISKKNKFIKIFELNERRGKQAVLEKLTPHAGGDIIIIHDADWIFKYKSKKDLLNYLSVFDDPIVGGISDSFPAEGEDPSKIKTKSFGFLSSAWGSYFLTNYIKKKFTTKRDNLLFYEIEKMKFCPFLDVYKKDIMEKTKHNSSLRAGDHVERCLRIISAGYSVVAFDNPNWPHFQLIYREQTISDLVNQKIRGFVSKDKIETAYKFKIPLFGFYAPFLLYIIMNSFRSKRFKDLVAIYLYISVMIYAKVISFYRKNLETKQVWELRMKR